MPGHVILRIPLSLGLLLFVCMPSASSWSAETETIPKSSPEAEQFFEKKIRPILLNRCAECHGEDLQEGGLRIDTHEGFFEGGESGKLLEPGKPNESRLIQVVRYNADLKMPPKSKIPDAEITDLIKWVEGGAVWPGAVASTPSVSKKTHPSAEGMKFTTEQKSFWAFQPMSNPSPPEVEDSSWVKSPIDLFILEKLREAKLTPAPAADRRALIRRVTFDLTGLPPTPEEVEAFVNDSSSDAFARVVDRLLATSQYGERWGRHWLDLARYADSNGLDENLAYANAFRYRDYVIDAFNKDKPYDEFLREQLAGDLLPPSDDYRVNNDRITATGFLSLGGKMLAEDDPVKMRMDIIDEQVDTIGKTVLGLTLGCARCHDHKYDPISMADYYGLAGIFESTKTMDTFTVVAKWHERPVASPESLQKFELLSKELEQQKQDREGLVNAGNQQVLSEVRAHAADYLRTATIHWQRRKALAQLKPIGGTEHGLSPDSFIDLEAEKFARGNVIVQTTAYGEGIGVILNGGPIPNFAEYDVSIPADRLQRLELRFAAAEARPVRVFLDGKLIRADAANQATGSWNPDGQRWEMVALLPLKSGNHTLRLERDGPFPHIDRLLIAPATLSQDSQSLMTSLGNESESLAPIFIQQWIAYLEKTENEPASPLGPWHALMRSAQSVSAPLLVDLKSETDQLVEKYRTAFAETDKQWQETLAGNRDSGGLNSSDREELRLVLYGPHGPCVLPKPGDIPYDSETAGKLAAFDKRIQEIEKQRPDLPAVMAVEETTPVNLKIHLRGNHLTLGDEVPRRFPRIFGDSPGQLPPQGSGRLEFARWLTQPEHPLTARVMVNRIWSYHFGEGLVRSPDNFGLLGERPTHPELLDWLSRRFVESGWSLKSLHRLILLSSTYQLSGTKSPDVEMLDPENRLWSYFPRRRLDAESIRDGILAVSGSLDLSPGGSLLPTPNRQYVTSTASVNPVVYQTNRRSVYLPVVRSALYEVLQAFDFADPSTPNGRRDSTTVAPQALFLMNSEFVLTQTKTLAESILKQIDLNASQRIDRLYRRLFGRPPAEIEVERAEKYLTGFTEAARSKKYHPDEAELYAWQSLCRVLLSTNEFLFLE